MRANTRSPFRRMAKESAVRIRNRQMSKRPFAKFMKLAIAQARKNLRKLDGGPFGACIVKNGRILAVARNTVLKNGDATCHAEMAAIRIASRRLKNFDLSGCAVYSTTEPCPMCFSALHWSRVDTIIFGTSIADVKKRGFNELIISNRTMKRGGKSNVKLVPGFLYTECSQLLKDWDRLEVKPVY